MTGERRKTLKGAEKMGGMHRNEDGKEGHPMKGGKRKKNKEKDMFKQRILG